MASITSTATGNWATGGTWVGGVAPGDGDTAILANGHVITIAAGTSVTVGNSAAPTTPAIQSAIATGGTGCLIVDTGATLTLKANVIQGNSAWQVNAGATINFLHATANLTWQIADGNTQANAKLVMAGTLGNRIVVQSTGAANSGGFGYQGGIAYVNSGRMECTYVSFTGIGTTSLPFNNMEFSATGVAFWDDCLFTSCGPIKTGNNYVAAGATIRIRRCSFFTPVNSSGRVVDFLFGTGTHSNILFDTLRWEGSFFSVAQSANVVGFTMIDCVGCSYGSGAVPFDCNSAPWTGTITGLFLYNKILASGMPANIPNGTYRNLCSMRMHDFNPHAMTIDPKQPTTIDTGVWEFGQSDERGDELQINTNPVSVGVAPISVKNIICPICPDGLQAAGAFMNVSHSGSSANNRLTMEHCTVGVSMVGATPGGAFTTENNTGGAGMAQAIHSNIGYRLAAGVGYQVFQVVGVLDADTFLNVDYNAHTPATITNTDVYNPLDVTFGQPDAPGLHDVADDPKFLDESRRFLSWGQSIDPAANTIQLIVDEMMKKNNDSGYNPAFTIDAYIRYMRAGFTPLNPRFATTGKYGTTIGAVPMTLPIPANGAGTLRHQRMR